MQFSQQLTNRIPCQVLLYNNQCHLHRMLELKAYLKQKAQVVLPSSKSGTMSPTFQGTFLMCFISGFSFCDNNNCLVNHPGTITKTFKANLVHLARQEKQDRALYNRETWCSCRAEPLTKSFTSCVAAIFKHLIGIPALLWKPNFSHLKFSMEM